MKEPIKPDVADTRCRQALTMVFIEMQELSDVYDETDAFRAGTLFPELDKPFCPGGCRP